MRLSTKHWTRWTLTKNGAPYRGGKIVPAPHARDPRAARPPACGYTLVVASTSAAEAVVRAGRAAVVRDVEQLA